MHTTARGDDMARTGKQCRERWHNHLDPSIKKSTWTREEDKILIDAHKTGKVSSPTLVSTLLLTLLLLL
jgi:hypothetical protein